MIRSVGTQVKRLSTSNEMSLPLLVEPLAKTAKSSVDLRCLSETWPRFRVRILPRYPAKLDVGDWELDIIGRTGILVSVMPIYEF